MKLEKTPNHSPLAIAFTGPSGSGKTTLIEKLIPELSSMGVGVGAVKRSHHRIEVDHPGKDSYRFREAGANPVLLLSDDTLFYAEKLSLPLTLGEALAMFAGKVDLALVEGFKQEAALRFVFAPLADIQSKSLHYGNDVAGFIVETPAPPGTVTDDGLPVFCRDNPRALAQWIIRDILPEKKRN